LLRYQGLEQRSREGAETEGRIQHGYGAFIRVDSEDTCSPGCMLLPSPLPHPRLPVPSSLVLLLRLPRSSRDPD